MAETRSVFEQGADRLEEVVRALKTQQIEERQGPIQTASSRTNLASPDEAWARQFATQCIGPVCFKVPPGSDMPLPPLTQALQSFPPARQSAYAPAPVTATAASRPGAAVPAKSGPIGAAIGKKTRRGLFARMLGRA